MGRRRITLDLDEDMLAAVDHAAGDRGQSRSRLISDATKRTMTEIERRRIDAEFESMAGDEEYQALLLSMEQELAPLSDEAWRILDRTEQGDHSARRSLPARP